MSGNESKPTGETLAEVARSIFGAGDPEAVTRWVRYWRQAPERCAANLQTLFLPLALIDFTGKTVLDIGCGTGGMGEVIGEQSRLYVGSDVHRHVLKFAGWSHNRGYVESTGAELPYAEACFDYILALDVLEHVQGGLARQEAFLRELSRVLKPLGMIFFTTPNWWHPAEGHTGLFGPQYLPSFLVDRYVGWRNPGFLKEHNTFAEIKSLRPAQLRRLIQAAGLEFLHQLPCGMDGNEFRQRFRLRGLMTLPGLGWFPHAEFWGILVQESRRDELRVKLRKNWVYEQRQPGHSTREFASAIDFASGTHNPQLISGWFWHEADRRPFRWIKREAVCRLQTDRNVSCLHVHGYTPWRNLIEVYCRGLRVGEHSVEAGEEFRLEYLVPFQDLSQELVEVKLRCRNLHAASGPNDDRRLGVQIFSLALT